MRTGREAIKRLIAQAIASKNPAEVEKYKATLQRYTKLMERAKKDLAEMEEDIRGANSHD
jgi:molecular chaperone DnaK (HSP70)